MMTTALRKLRIPATIALFATLVLPLMSHTPVRAQRVYDALPSNPYLAVKLLTCWNEPHSRVRGCTPHRSSSYLSPCYRHRDSKGAIYSIQAGCPVTKRLHARLRPNPAPDADPICRCQNVPPRLTFSSVAQTSKRQWINAVYYWTPKHIPITFVVVKRGHSWLVDDTYCAGRPKTTIYRSPIGPC